MKHIISSIRRRIRRIFKDQYPHLRYSETLWMPDEGPYRLEKVPGSHKPMVFWEPDDHEQTNSGSYGFRPTRSVNRLKRIWFATKVQIAWRRELWAAKRSDNQRFDTLIAGRVNKHDLEVLGEGLDKIKTRSASRTGLDYAQRGSRNGAFRHTN